MLAIRRTRRIRGPPPAFVRRRAKFRMFLSPIFLLDDLATGRWTITARSRGQQFTKSGLKLRVPPGLDDAITMLDGGRPVQQRGRARAARAARTLPSVRQRRRRAGELLRAFGS